MHRRVSRDHPPRTGDHGAPLACRQIPVVGPAERVAEDSGYLVADERHPGEVEQVSSRRFNRAAAELGILVPVLGVAVVGVVGPAVVRVGVEDEEPADEGHHLVEPAGRECGVVVALVLGGVEEVDEQPLEQEERHAPPRPPCVVHCHAVESDCTPMAGKVEECGPVAPLREFGQTLLRNDPFDPDEVLHATLPLPMRREKRNTQVAVLRSRRPSSAGRPKENCPPSVH